MFIILFGLFLQCFTIYGYVGKPDDNICTLRIWITNIPLTIIIMAIFAQVNIYLFNIIIYYIILNSHIIIINLILFYLLKKKVFQNLCYSK